MLALVSLALLSTAALAAPTPAPDAIRYLYKDGGNFCLDNRNGIIEDGNLVQLYECSLGNPNQMWSHIDEETHQIRLVGTEMCLGYKQPKRGSAAGAPVLIARCDSDPSVYYTKWSYYEGDMMCADVGRCISYGGAGANGVTFTMATTHQAKFEEIAV